MPQFTGLQYVEKTLSTNMNLNGNIADLIFDITYLELEWKYFVIYSTLLAQYNECQQ